jgi:Flp pilus assembly protein TadD
MRLIVLCALVLLAGCGRPAGPRLSDQRPELGVADAALAAGAPSVALSVAEGLLADHPANADALLRKGEASYRLGDLATARTSFLAVLSKQPDSYEAQLGMGRVELASNARAAQIRFQRLAALQPRNVTALTDLGIAYDLLGQHDTAQRMYRMALTIAPDLVSARSNLGLSLALSAQPDMAMQVLRPLDATRAQSARMRENLTTVMSGPSGYIPPPLETAVAPPELSANAAR